MIRKLHVRKIVLPCLDGSHAVVGPIHFQARAISGYLFVAALGTPPESPGWINIGPIEVDVPRDAFYQAAHDAWAASFGEV